MVSQTDLIILGIIIGLTFFIAIGTLPPILVPIPISILLFYLWYLRQEAKPKSLADSVRVAREFVSRILYNEKKPVEVLDILETSRHKDFAYGSKKKLIHKIVMQLNDGRQIAVIDDPYIRHNPASVIHYSITAGHVAKPVKSAVELEREIKPQPIIYPQTKFKKRIEIKKKEETKG